MCLAGAMPLCAGVGQVPSGNEAVLEQFIGAVNSSVAVFGYEYVIDDGRTEITGAVGNGPVNALDVALRRALCVFYPQVSSMHLTDFKVRVIDMSSTTAAKIRVLIESTNGDESWTTIGVSNDIIEASFTALTDSFEYILSRKGE